MKTTERMGCGLSGALLVAIFGCGGSDVSSFGEGPGGGGGATAAGNPTAGPTSTGATTSGSQGGAGEGAAGQGGSGQGGSGQGASGQGGEGGAGQGGEGAAGPGGAGPGGGGPTCGDDTCDGGETCESCADDCGRCEPECVEHTDCSSDDLCIEEVCESAYGRTYEFTVVNGLFPIVDPSNGTEWDPVGPPDPFVRICSEVVCPAGTTTTQDDSSAPVWNESFSVELSGPDGDIWFSMWDEDVADDDFALQTPLGSPAEWVDIVRTEGGTYVYEASPGLQLRIDVSPL